MPICDGGRSEASLACAVVDSCFVGIQARSGDQLCVGIDKPDQANKA